MPRKRQSTKSRIVKSAWNLFYKNGYDDTTVEDIITASKTSKGTFYHYFKSKEGLLNTLSYLFDEKYEELYNNRNKLAHNTLSYQDNLPSLKSLQNESDNSRNYFVWFFILVLIDKIFMDLFQIYMAELEENIF